jgi:hypothetical protein
VENLLEQPGNKVRGDVEVQIFVADEPETETAQKEIGGAHDQFAFLPTIETNAVHCIP